MEPPPGLAALETLAAPPVRRSRRQHPRARVAEAARTGLDQAVYRILQEALTNAAKHGNGTAEVDIGFGPSSLELTVTNSTNWLGLGRSRPRIVGMRERANLLGGQPRSRGQRRSLPRSSATSPRWRGRMSRGRVRVLLVDDDDLIRAGLKAVLSTTTRSRSCRGGRRPRCRLRGPRVQAGRRSHGRAHARPRWHLGDTRGRLRLARESKVAIPTTFEQDDYIFGALNAGASGFLLKRTKPEELIAAIHALAAGDSLLSPSVTRRVIERMSQQPVALG